MAASQSDRAPKENAILECGADGIHEGPVIGCCYVCGLLLCRAHLFHKTRPRDFGTVDRRKAAPITCGEHAGFFSRQGWPETASAGTPPARRRLTFFRPKSKAKGAAAQRQKRRG